MATTALPSPTEMELKTTQPFLELYGSLKVMNNYLQVALLALALVCVASSVVILKMFEKTQNIKPWIVRINEVGRAEAVGYDNFEYHQPQEAEIKYFLIQFTEQYYGRIRATAKEDYPRSLHFLEEKLADSIIESNKKSKSIEQFLAGQGEEIDVKVNNISIENLQTSPYRATVDFEKVYYGTERQESRREVYTANVTFMVKDRVPNSLIPINPLGLTIVALHEDQHFDQ